MRETEAAKKVTVRGCRENGEQRGSVCVREQERVMEVGKRQQRSEKLQKKKKGEHEVELRKPQKRRGSFAAECGRES